jgi:hypothetical protein
MSKEDTYQGTRYIENIDYFSTQDLTLYRGHGSDRICVFGAGFWKTMLLDDNDA